MPLTDLECRKAKADQKLVKLTDMGGLQLWVYPTVEALALRVSLRGKAEVPRAWPLPGDDAPSGSDGPGQRQGAA